MLDLTKSNVVRYTHRIGFCRSGVFLCTFEKVDALEKLNKRSHLGNDCELSFLRLFTIIGAVASYLLALR